MTDQTQPMVHSWAQVRQLTDTEMRVAVSSDSCSSGGCGSSLGCSSNAFTGLFLRQPLLRLKRQPGVCEGDWLLLSLPEGALLRLVGWAYGAPLLGLLLGAALGQWLSGDLLALLLGVLALLTVWWGVGRVGIQTEPDIVSIQKSTGEGHDPG